MKKLLPLVLLAMLAACQSHPTHHTHELHLAKKDLLQKSYAGLRGGAQTYHYRNSRYKGHEIFLSENNGYYKGHIFITGREDSAYTLLTTTADSLIYSMVPKDDVICTRLATVGTTVPLLLAVAPVHIPVPSLQSLPGSPFVIYLNLNGDTVNNKNWYDSTIYAAQPNLTPTQMVEIFNRVAEKFRPFNINVTTSLAVYNAAASTKKTKVDITPTYAWYGVGVGGVTYVGAFGWEAYSPCWVFTSNLANNPEYIADAVVHEVGHALGLQHHGWYTAGCAKNSDYMIAQGAGVYGWGAVMGAPYGANFVLWYFGATTGATCTANPYQDDLNIITTQNGFGYRPHQVKRAMSMVNGTVRDSGIIVKRGDADTLQFTCNGTMRLQVHSNGIDTVKNSGACLVPKVTLTDAAGSVLRTDSGNTTLCVWISRTSMKGTYNLIITNAGNPNFTTQGAAPSAGTNYGSLGMYKITGTITGIAPPPPPACTTPTVNITPATAALPAGATQTFTAAGATNYLWSTGATTQSIMATATNNATYTVTGTVAGGCSARASCTVTVNAAPPPTGCIANTAPTMTGHQQTATTITATWKDNGMKSYNFAVFTPNGGAFIKQVTVPGGTLTATINGLTANTFYYIRLQGVCKANSTWSTPPVLVQTAVK